MRNLGFSVPPVKSERSHWATVRDLLVHVWPEGETEVKLRVLAALGCLIASKVAEAFVPILFKDAVDALDLSDADAPDIDALVALPLGLLVAYGLARVAAPLFSELREALFAKVAQRAIRRVALRTFRHLHSLALRFHLERQTGGLSRIIERGVKAIEFVLVFTLFNIIPTFLALVLAAGVLWHFCGWQYAAVTLATIGGYVWFTVGVTNWRLRFRRAMNESDNNANTKAIDSLLNFETVKYFGNEEHEARRYDEGLAKYESAAVQSRTSLSLLNVGQSLIISAGATALMIMAAAGAVQGAITKGEFVMVNAYLLQLAQPLNFLGFVYREIKQSLVDMEAMFVLLHVEREVRDEPNAPMLAVPRGEIAFDRVGFAYDPRRPILKNVSFTAPAGGTIAVVGPSGAGKSTISRLLFRFYDVTEGAIRIDGQDIRDVAQASLRDAIGIVPQDTVLFNDTVYYNIAYGRPDAAPSEIEAAARLAAIHDFIVSTPDGYRSLVGERGLKLSGGEKQRVAIARTILKDPRLLIFDEATSALDTSAEQEIQNSLREVSADRTTLVIAHRLSTIVDADEILVLRKGEIAERGRHADLLARGGAYARMWARQQADAERRGTLPETAPEDPASRRAFDPRTPDS